MKTLATKSQLEIMALEELRSFPSCELVVSVAIEHRPDRPLDSNWALLVNAKHGADVDRIHHASRTVSDRLKRRYDLRLE